MKGANEVMVEYLIGAITAVELSDWAADLLLSDDPLSTDKRVIDIAAHKNQCLNDANRSQYRLMEQIISEYYADFKIPSIETERYARNALREKCAGYLVGRLAHSREIVTLADRISELFNRPKWLGHLPIIAKKYNGCANQKRFENELNKEVILRLQEL